MKTRVTVPRQAVNGTLLVVSDAATPAGEGAILAAQVLTNNHLLGKVLAYGGELKPEQAEFLAGVLGMLLAVAVHPGEKICWLTDSLGALHLADQYRAHLSGLLTFAGVKGGGEPRHESCHRACRWAYAKRRKGVILAPGFQGNSGSEEVNHRWFIFNLPRIDFANEPLTWCAEVSDSLKPLLICLPAKDKFK